MIIQIVLIFCIIIGYGSSLGFFVLHGVYIPAAILGALGLVLSIPKMRNYRWVQGLALFSGVLCNLTAVWLQFPIAVILLSTAFMLGVYEFSQFHDFLKLACEEDQIKGIEQRHIIITLISLVLTFAISLSVVQLKIETNFYQALFLVILVFVGMILFFRMLITSSAGKNQL